jgi:hypothetical protein
VNFWQCSHLSTLRHIDQFNLYSKTLLSYTDHRLKVLAESLEAMSTAITSHGLNGITATGEIPWPYVTLPSDQFEANAEHDTSFSRNHFIWATPIVHDVEAWNTYNAEVFSNSDVPVNPFMFSYGIDGKLPINGTGPFVPIHQLYAEAPILNSVNNSMINYDTSSDPNFRTFITLVSNLRSATLTGLLPLSFLRYSYPDAFDASELLSIYVEPVFSTFEETSEVVGYIQSLFEWKYFFASFNFDGIDIVCVIENTCSDQFAFAINNNLATYISKEDSYTKRLNDVSATSVIGLDTDDISSEEIEFAKAAGLCIYSLTVYPTKEFRESFNSNAVLYTAIVGLVMFSMVA